MSTMFLVTLGSRDVRLDGAEIRTAMIEREKIAKDLDQYLDRLSFPIIEPALDFILRRELHIDRIVLVATKQPVTVNEKYRSNDTYFFAEVVERYYRQKFKGNPRIKDYKIFIVEHNPNFVDEMYDFFGLHLPSNKIFRIDDLQKCCVLTTGGIPAVCAALMMQAIQSFQDKCFPLYISEKSQSVIPLRIGYQLRRQFLISVLRRLLANFDYAAASHLLQEAGESKILCIPLLLSRRLRSERVMGVMIP
jgi:hypothetical protein